VCGCLKFKWLLHDVVVHFVQSVIGTTQLSHSNINYCFVDLCNAEFVAAVGQLKQLTEQQLEGHAVLTTRLLWHS
jgi:hypothetical protein